MSAATHVATYMLDPGERLVPSLAWHPRPGVASAGGQDHDQLAARALGDASPDVGVTPMIADRSLPLVLPPPDGIVVADPLHFERDRLAVLRPTRGDPRGGLPAPVATRGVAARAILTFRRPGNP